MRMTGCGLADLATVASALTENDLRRTPTVPRTVPTSSSENLARTSAFPKPIVSDDDDGDAMSTPDSESFTASKKRQVRSGMAENSPILPARKKRLPPKKRAVMARMSEIPKQSPARFQDNGSSKTTAALSEGSTSSLLRHMYDAALSSRRSSVVTLVQRLGHETTLVSSMSSSSKLPVARVSLDASFVAAALRRRDQEERIRVAKAMLYQSFIKAAAEKKGEA